MHSERSDSDAEQAGIASDAAARTLRLNDTTVQSGTDVITARILAPGSDSQDMMPVNLETLCGSYCDEKV